jgi:hypothetical protein
VHSFWRARPLFVDATQNWYGICQHCLSTDGSDDRGSTAVMQGGGAAMKGWRYRENESADHVPIPMSVGSYLGSHQDRGFWIEPCTGKSYPLAFEAYRRQRETEERPHRAHRTMGPDVDEYVWRRWGNERSNDVEVEMTLRPNTPPRIRRLIGEVLRGIRRGATAAFVIQQVSTRFKLRQARMRACLAACLGITKRARGDALSRVAERPWL